MFDDGAVVQSLSLPSDFSSILLSGLAPESNSGDVTTYLIGLGFDSIEEPCVRLKQIPSSSEQVAEINVPDPAFARLFLEKAGPNPSFYGRDVTATPQQQISSKSEAGSSAKRLQLSTVSCTWQQPSKRAWLYFGSHLVARQAVKRLKVCKMLHGRKLKVGASERGPWGPSEASNQVMVGNLHVAATKDGINEVLGHLRPRIIEFGPPTYRLSSLQAETCVKSLLEDQGALYDWEVSGQASNDRVKATARFLNPEDARRAAEKLDGERISELGDSKVYVALITSVKFSVLSQILDAVRTEMDNLKARFWNDKFVHIKTYPAPAHKPHTVLRIFGENRKSVGEAKSSVDKLLAGTVAKDGDAPTWDPFFFQPEGLKYLAMLMTRHSAFVYRDLRKGLLQIYGSQNAVAETQQALRKKALELAAQIQVIALEGNKLKAALQGGFRRLVQAFGKDAAKMNIASNPKTVTFRGSTKDFERARNLLLGGDDVPLEDHMDALATVESDELCPVCWTEPEDPTSMLCGHAYCRDCLTGQCSSVEDANLPLRCLGTSATCDRILSLPELQGAIPESAFEAMLQASFTLHVRKFPEIFQYCPTPDCDRVYRVNARGGNFFCDNCFTDVCTACHAVAHDGFSCAEAKDLAGEGELAFARWKAENDVRGCPNCKAPIEKTYGCNHMECGGCRIHICWFCMKTFRRGEDTYAHMGTEHGNIDLG